MRGRIIRGVALLLYGAVLLALLGATPHQGLPNPAIFQGSVTIDGEPAPEGTLIVACVANKECGPDHADPAFQRVGDTVNATGRLIALTAQGTDHAQIGNATVYFFLINDHGRVEAGETAIYGSSDPTTLFFQQNLTFGAAATPEPTPTPATPTPTPTPATPEPTPTPATPTPTPPQTPTAAPTPETDLPIPGEPLVPQLANVVLYGGIALLIVGSAGLVYARRRLS